MKKTQTTERDKQHQMVTESKKIEEEMKKLEVNKTMLTILFLLLLEELEHPPIKHLLTCLIMQIMQFNAELCLDLFLHVCEIWFYRFFLSHLV